MWKITPTCRFISSFYLQYFPKITLTGSWPQNFRKKIEQKSKCKKDSELDQLKFGSWKSKKWLVVHCFSVNLGLGLLVFLQRARKGKKIEKIPQERIETNHKVNLWVMLGLEKQVHLKMVYPLFLTKWGKIRAKLTATHHFLLFWAARHIPYWFITSMIPLLLK